MQYKPLKIKKMKTYKCMRVEEPFFEQMCLYYSFLKSYDMHTIAYKEERQNKEKSTKKENKKKVEKLSLSTREALFCDLEKTNSEESVSSIVIPTKEEVQSYLDSLGEKRFTGEIFCDYYAVDGWLTKSNRPIKNWKAKVRDWRKMEKTPTHKKKHNETNNHVTHSSEQAGGPSEADLLAAEAQRDDVLDRRLEVVFKGDKRISWLSRNLNAMAKALGVSIADYDVETITDDARHLSDLWYRDWSADVFCEAFKWVSQRFNTITKPTVSSKVRELFFLYGQEKGLTPKRRQN